MNRSTLHKSTLREIKGSLGRFIAIFGIIALGVGFFSGVRITTPAMLRTINDLYVQHSLFDLQLVSTLGWEQDQVDRIKAEKGVRSAEGAIQADVVFSDSEGHDAVYKTHSITKNINTLLLREGRLPEKDDEILLDNNNRAGFSLGDIIRLSDVNEKDTSDHFKHSQYTIVGFADSPLYINFERGGTSLGNGSVTGFAYLDISGYADDYFTEIFVKKDSDYDIYSDEYEKDADKDKDRFKQVTEEAALDRYDRLMGDARSELDDAKSEFADKKIDGQAELDDARTELNDARKELDDAKKEIDDGEKEIRDNEKKLKDGQAELEKGRKELDDARATLEATDRQLMEADKKLKEGQAELEANKKKLDKAQKDLNDAEAVLKKNKAALDSADASLKTGKAALDATKQQLDSGSAALDAKDQELAGAYSAGLMDDASYAAASAAIAAEREKITQGFAAYEAGLAQYNASLAEYNTGLAAYNAGEKEYRRGLAEYNSGKKQYDQGVAEFNKGKAAYTAGLAAWIRGRQEYEDALARFRDSEKELEDGIRKLTEGKKKLEDGKTEYEDGLAEYEDGLAEYEDGRKEFDEKISEAEEKIRDAEDEINDISEPDTYVLERGTNIAYTCFESDSKIVAQVARVFPIFFILVAALVCMTTMTRMVEEMRSQIGLLKALGYTEGDIMGKFTFYSGTAAVLGCCFGYGTGIFIFRSVIWYAYLMMYIDLPLHYIFDPALAAASLIAALICSVGITYLTCRVELFETAASLMRPKAPKPGKRVFLEYVPFIWNRMKFLHKVSVRNIFRYKRRLFMMILGISGCTALVLTGFGMKDSIAGFSAAQYDNILTADAQVTFKNGTKNKIPPSLEKLLDEKTKSYALLSCASWNLVSDHKTKSINLLVPSGKGSFTDFFHLKKSGSPDTPLSEPGKGQALICASLSERYDIREGDTLTLRNEDMETVNLKVSGIFENHVYNYVIASKENFDLDISDAYVDFEEDTDVHMAQTIIARNKNVTYVELFDDFKTRLTNMMESLNLVVLAVIMSAAGLAFIVLYNLTNINITERLREIATIKVLGFYPGETAQYVFRENILLTFLGMIAGLFLGVLLHRFVMSQIIVDMVYFEVRILKKSYIYSMLLTFLFTFLVNLVMNGKLEKINMAESLKSVE